MPVNQAKLDTLLGAVQSKDVAAIVAAQVTIPFLTKPYTANQLQTWLAKRVTRLQSLAGTVTEAEAIAARTTLYDALNAAGKVIADNIIAGESVIFPSNLTSANYDRLIGITLITFILT